METQRQSSCISLTLKIRQKMTYDNKPEAIERLKLNNLAKDPPSKTIFLETAQQTKPIARLANNIRIKEIIIAFIPKP